MAGSGAEGALGTEDDGKSVRDKVPFILDATDGITIGRQLTSGWDRVTKITAEAKAPAEIVVDMNGGTVIPELMFHDISDRDMTVYFVMDDRVTWVVNGMSFTEESVKDTDMRVREDTRNIPAQKINEIADVYPHIDLSLAHDGDFGFTAILRLNTGKSNSGMYANLYYYDEDKKELLYVNASRIDGNGYAVFDFLHASDYTVIIRGDDMAGRTVLKDSAASDPDSGYIAPQTINSRHNNRLWLVLVSLLSVLLCFVIMVAPDERKNNRYVRRSR